MDPEIDLGADDWHMWPFCILVICVNSWLNAQFCTHGISLPDREENLNMIFNSWKPANPKGNQPWIFIGKTDAEAPILWPLDETNWLIGKVPDAGKDWGQEEKWVTEDEMIGWHHWLHVHESEQSQVDSEGPGSLAHHRSLGHKESNTT